VKSGGISPSNLEAIQQLGRKMDSLQTFDYNGTVIQRRYDGFVNLTQMCQANRKRLTHWLNLKSTQDYIQFITAEDGITASDVIEVIQGSSVQGTWGHPELAIDLAKWISNEFRRWCNAHIFNLMSTGRTSLEIDPIEEMKLRVELASLENQKAANELAILNLRNTIVLTCPEPVQQKILGYQVVEKIEVIERITPPLARQKEWDYLHQRSWGLCEGSPTAIGRSTKMNRYSGRCLW